MRRPTIALTFGRRDPADHERAVECGWQGVGVILQAGIG
jgi:hypothetical protein